MKDSPVFLKNVRYLLQSILLMIITFYVNCFIYIIETAVKISHERDNISGVKKSAKSGIY